MDLPALAGPRSTTPRLADRVRAANTALEALQICADHGVPLGDLVAARAREVALGVLRRAPVTVDVVVIDRGAPSSAAKSSRS